MGVDLTLVVRSSFNKKQDSTAASQHCDAVASMLNQKLSTNIFWALNEPKYNEYSVNVNEDYNNDIYRINICDGFYLIEVGWRHSQYFNVLNNGKIWLREILFRYVRLLGATEAYVCAEYATMQGKYWKDGTISFDEWLHAVTESQGSEIKLIDTNDIRQCTERFYPADPVCLDRFDDLWNDPDFMALTEHLAIYHTSMGDFNTWFSQLKSCKQLIICGELTVTVATPTENINEYYDDDDDDNDNDDDDDDETDCFADQPELASFNAMFKSQSIKIIDLSDFNVTFVNEKGEKVSPPIAYSAIGKMIAFHHSIDEFIVNGGLVLSSDGKKLIHNFYNGDVNVPDTVEEIGTSAFADNKKLKNVKLPPNIKVIGDYAFYGCKNLTSVDFPDGLTTIGKSAFEDCKNIYHIKLPDSVTEIGENAFMGTESCEIIKLSSGLSTISKGCFCGADIDDIVIPPSVKKIETAAFCECQILGAFSPLIIPEGVECIENDAFALCQFHEVQLPASLTYIHYDAFYSDCCDQPHVKIDPDNKVYYSKDGILYKRRDDSVVLGSKFIPPPPEPPLLKPYEMHNDKYMPIDEAAKDYPPANVRPINSNKNLYWVFSHKLGYNIIDHYGNLYFKKDSEISYIFDKYVMVRGADSINGVKNYVCNIYSADLNKLLFTTAGRGYGIMSMDSDGLLYVTTDDPELKGKFTSPFANYSVCGCVDMHGNIIIPLEYKELNHFDYNGFAVAMKKSRKGIINMRNEVIIPFEYKELDTFDRAGMARAQKGRHMGFINIHNEAVIPFVYDHIDYHGFGDTDDCAIATIHHGIPRWDTDEHLLINRKNEVCGWFQLLSYHYTERGFHLYTHNGMMGYARQFGMNRSGAIYKKIEQINELTIRISKDGIHYETLHYDTK